MVFVAQQYLKRNLYDNLINEFEESYSSHPNYPSLYAVTDTFTLLGIENIAAQIPKDQLPELPDSFLAIFKQDLVLVSKTSTLVTIDTEKGEKQNLSFDEFSANWNGVIIAIEPNETFSSESLKGDSKWLKYSFPILVLVILSLFYNSYGLSDYVLLITSIAGLLISVFIVQEKLGFKNQIVSKFCNISTNTSCDSVIKSDKGEINKWLSFSDLPLVFFSINLLSIVLQPTSSSNVVGLLSLLSLPVIVYSVWVQIMQLKKWCLLCLVISFLVVTQSMVWVFVAQSILDIDFSNLFTYLFSMVMITSLWLGVKPILENKIKAEKAVNELKQFKRNYDVFGFLSKEIPDAKGFDHLEGLRFGSNNADVKLTIILSPSCGHCHKAFQDAFELVSKYSEKVFLNVLFNINPDNNDNPYKVVVERLLVINSSNSNMVEEAISDWHIKKMGLEVWKEKWHVDSINMKVNLQIEKQYNWCLENEFNYTPVKIVNEKLFPNEYDISELKYFLNDFAEEKEIKVNILLESL